MTANNKKTMKLNSFSPLSSEELIEVDGGIIVEICTVIGTVLAVGTAIYGYGYACGQRDAYEELAKSRHDSSTYGKVCPL